MIQNYMNGGDDERCTWAADFVQMIMIMVLGGIRIAKKC